MDAYAMNETDLKCRFRLICGIAAKRAAEGNADDWASILAAVPQDAPASIQSEVERWLTANEDRQDSD